MATAAVVSVSMGVMKPVLAKLATLMGDECKKVKGLRKEVTFLQRELGDMDALLEKMDKADELDPQAKKWRKDIIEMSYDIEDRIDDFMQNVGEADDKMGIIQKASQYLKTFKDRHRLANQFQEIKTRVMEASERRKRYMLDQCISITTPATVDPRLSALYKESESLVGIKTQKDELVKWVIEEGKELKVMAIVGSGGLGKTTLANEVYREVGEQFNLKAFISVSQKPEVVGIFNSLKKQIGLVDSHSYQMQDLISDIRRHLQDKRYLVLVDDLWDIRAWNTIACAFPQNNQQGRVVITTRIKGVATACCGNHGFIHTMEPLSEADSRKLFFDRIFGSKDACPSELMKASDEILKKCGGLPLAIITIASMLACQPRILEGQWEYIQNSLATKVATDYEDMMYILGLSYKNLPHHLKACFLYLGSYPEDYYIDRVELVRRWVAEGFVCSSDGKDVWDAAERYFYELVNRSMIQPVHREYSIEAPVCRVHDMLLELIVRRCEDDNFLTLVNDTREMEEVQGKVIRRLNVVGSKNTDDGKAIAIAGGNLSQIRCLTMLRQPCWTPPLQDFKFLRVLSLAFRIRREVDFDLTGINQLSQLRYLMISNIECIMLPSQIQGLQFLQTLDFSDIFSSRFTFDIVDVPSLFHLCLCAPKEGCGSSLTWMATLRSSLEKLSNLRQLTVGRSGPIGVAWCADTLSSLSPPFHNLEFLALSAVCTFSRVPRWIVHLQNLRALHLGAKQVLQEDVAMIGTRLPSLLVLALRIPCAPTESIMIGGSMGFAHLKLFDFDCDRISDLAFEAEAMPELKVLELTFDVDKWDKATPRGLQHLRSLEKIIAHRAYREFTWSREPEDEEAEKELIRGVFQEAADAFPTRAPFTLGGGRRIRPKEEE